MNKQDLKYYVPGSVLFNLHTEQGFSIGLSLWALQDHPTAEVHWFNFFSEASKKGWKTYQVYDMLQAAYQDDTKVFPDFKDTLHRLMLYASLFDPEYNHLLEDTSTVQSMKQQIEREVYFVTNQCSFDTLLFRKDGVVIPIGMLAQDGWLFFGKLTMDNHE